MSFVLCVLCLAAFASCARKETQRADFVLGTLCSVRFFEPQKTNVFDAVFNELYRLDDILSANKEGSGLDEINRNAGIKPVPAARELLVVLSSALRYAALSEQYAVPAPFDPTIGPLVRLWGIGTEKQRVPDRDAVEAVKTLVNWHDVEIDKDAGTVFLRRRGMKLDLGAIAKGYAADRAAEIISGFGVERAIIDLGGNIVALGEKADGEPYKVGIQDPAAPRGTYSGYIEVKNKSLVTSGSYERFFEEGGVRYHHILSTATGYPVRNDLTSVTVIAPKSIDADALSTTVFALGREKGTALIESLPDTDAIFIGEDGRITLTGGARASFHAN